jgi:hypothetical protein
MGADDLDAASLETACQDLQQAVVAAGERHHQHGHQREQAEA